MTETIADDGDAFRYRDSRVVVAIIDRALKAGKKSGEILAALEVSESAVLKWRATPMTVRPGTARRARRLERRLDK